MKKRCLEFVTDDSGKMSSSRFLVTISVLCYLAYGWYVVYHTKTMPDIPMGAGTMIAALYAANKFSPTNPFPGGPQK